MVITQAEAERYAGIPARHYRGRSARAAARSDITQKAFAESIGMNTQHLSTVKASERHNRIFHELGAIKAACLWFLERFEKP